MLLAPGFKRDQSEWGNVLMYVELDLFSEMEDSAAIYFALLVVSI